MFASVDPVLLQLSVKQKLSGCDDNGICGSTQLHLLRFEYMLDGGDGLMFNKVLLRDPQ